jgi:hypothetical protein
VQASAGRWRLTPDMKLVARVGPAPAPAAPARPGPAGRGPTGKKLAKPPPPPLPSPAQEAVDARALLQAAGSLLGELARCARPG